MHKHQQEPKWEAMYNVADVTVYTSTSKSKSRGLCSGISLYVTVYTRPEDHVADHCVCTQHQQG